MTLHNAQNLKQNLKTCGNKKSQKESRETKKRFTQEQDDVLHHVGDKISVSRKCEGRGNKRQNKRTEQAKDLIKIQDHHI